MTTPSLNELIDLAKSLVEAGLGDQPMISAQRVLSGLGISSGPNVFVRDEAGIPHELVPGKRYLLKYKEQTWSVNAEGERGHYSEDEDLPAVYSKQLEKWVYPKSTYPHVLEVAVFVGEETE